VAVASARAATAQRFRRVGKDLMGAVSFRGAVNER
jgi:hypothetical protein